jgi:hypothetical protein
MSVNVLLTGGPRTGDTVSIAGPWPRKFIYVDDEAGGSAKYLVTVEGPPGEAEYVAPGTYTDPGIGTSVVGPTGASGPPGPPGAEGPEGPQGEGMTYQGDWDIATAYDALDVVRYDGAVYVATTTSGAEQPDLFPDVWVRAGEKGDPGAEGPQGEMGSFTYRGEWFDSFTHEYFINDVVSYQGSSYVRRVDAGPNFSPTSDVARWQLLAAKGSPLPPRQATVLTTASLASGGSETGTVELATGFRVLHIETSRPAWVRLYTTPAKRDADAGRIISDDPTGDHGVVIEVETDALVLALDLSPVPQGYSMEDPPVNDIAYRVTNLDAATGTVEVTFTWQEQEST